MSGTAIPVSSVYVEPCRDPQSVSGTCVRGDCNNRCHRSHQNGSTSNLEGQEAK